MIAYRVIRIVCPSIRPSKFLFLSITFSSTLPRDAHIDQHQSNMPAAGGFCGVQHSSSTLLRKKIQLDLRDSVGRFKPKSHNNHLHNVKQCKISWWWPRRRTYKQEQQQLGAAAQAECQQELLARPGFWCRRVLEIGRILSPDGLINANPVT